MREPGKDSFPFTLGDIDAIFCRINFDLRECLFLRPPRISSRFQKSRRDTGDHRVLLLLSLTRFFLDLVPFSFIFPSTSFLLGLDLSIKNGLERGSDYSRAFLGLFLEQNTHSVPIGHISRNDAKKVVCIEAFRKFRVYSPIYLENESS